MQRLGAYQAYFAVNTALLCEIALICYGSDIVCRGTVYLYRENILAAYREVGYIKAERGIPALVSAREFAVDIKLGNGVRSLKFYEKPLELVYNDLLPVTAPPAVIFLLRKRRSHCAVLRVPCMGQGHKLPSAVIKINGRIAL